MARKKIVPPVTPRIVQPNAGHRFLRYALLFCALLLAAWFSYDYGRTQAPATAEAPLLQSGESEASEQGSTGLEQERDTLRQQVTELQQRMQQARQDLEAAQARIQSLQQADSAQREAPISALQPEPEPAPVSTVSASANNTLKLENVQIEATESANVFRISFSVMQDGSGRVTGTIWIAVNGFSDGEPSRLSFKRLSPDRRSYVKMGFDLQQDVTEDVVLPDNFRPKNVLIEAKPYGDVYTGTAVKIDWFTAG